MTSKERQFVALLLGMTTVCASAQQKGNQAAIDAEILRHF